MGQLIFVIVLCVIGLVIGMKAAKHYESRHSKSLNNRSAETDDEMGSDTNDRE